MNTTVVTESPLVPVYPFNAPGMPIVLHDGSIGGLAPGDVAGVVELSCRPEPGLEWSVASDTPPAFANLPKVTLVLRRPSGDMPVSGIPRDPEGGWANAAVFGKTDAPLKRIVAHWFNLPRWTGQIGLSTKAADGSERMWSGSRWRHQAGDWQITIDVRPDHRDVWADLHKEHVYVMTHVMELCRVDGTTFTPEEAEPVLEALHLGVSFALGRWVAPMLPVGQDTGGQAVWESWSPLFCDPAQSTSSGWWSDRGRSSLVDLAKLLDPVISEFSVPASRTALSMRMKYAITALRAQGFVEQRITIGTAGLEHLMWEKLFLSNRLTTKEYKYNANGWSAVTKLRTLLTEAGVSTAIDTSALPAATAFAAMELQTKGRTLDGADVVTEIRNELMHPKGDQEAVYQIDGLARDAWLLTRHYLVLLILHSLAYSGSYQDLTKISTSHVSAVPWS